jgi:putative transposase
MTPHARPPLEIRLRVLSAVDYAPGQSIRDRIKAVAERTFTDTLTGVDYQFTWRTISTWLYRHKKHGITTIDNRTRADKGTQRKVKLSELAEAIDDVLPTLAPSKSGRFVKSVVYRQLLAKNYFQRTQLASTTFYRFAREHQLLEPEQTRKLRQSFSMQFANELWQADTMYGPAILQDNEQWRKTFLIAFIDDASRVITHAEFFYRDNTHNMISAFRAGLYKRGKPDRLYFDNGSNYTSKEILQACIRLDIKLSHAPIRDGSAKGKIERFFRRFRDQFLTTHTQFKSLDDLNQQTQQWVEEHYNSQFHHGIQMCPIDRFNLDTDRIRYLTQDQYSEEIFYIEKNRTVNKTNVFPIDCRRFECPVDLREQKIQVRFDRNNPVRFIVYFND